VVEGELALGELERLHGLWDVVAVPHTARSPWLDCVVRAFPGVEPVALLVEDGDDVVAAAFLGRRSGRVVQWTVLGHEVNDYAVLAAADDDAARRLADAIVDRLRQERRPWRLRLDQLPPGDPVAARLVALLPTAALTEGTSAARLSLTEPRTLDRHATRNARRSARRGLNLLRRHGHEPVFAHIREPAAVMALLDRVVDIHRARDHQVGRRSDLDDPALLAFYRDVVGQFAARGNLELTTVTVGGELAAFALALLDGDSYRLWDGRVAPAWTEYSLGRNCDFAALEAALGDERFTTVDWMRGVMDYKTQVMTHTADFENLHAWSSRAVRGAYASAATGRAALRAGTPATIRRWARLRGRASAPVTEA
jgi:CelD/BcsL family acetyltransferase involved in cellulose biosynthesis